MAIDRVRALKMETDARGTQIDEFPTALDPGEDYLESRGVALQNDTSDDETVILTRDASNRMTVKDAEITSATTIRELRTLQNLYTGVAEAGKTPQTDGAGGITLADVVSGYPPSFSTALSDTVETWTLSDWKEKVSVTTPSLELGSYVIFAQAILSGSKSNAQYEVRSRFDDTDVIGSQSAQAGVAFSEQLFFTHTIKNSISGAHTIDIDFRMAAGSGYVSIRSARITYWRVSAS